MRVYRSKISRAVHEMASDLFEVGAIQESRMREYDGSCLVSLVAMTPEDILALRQREEVTETELARHLGVSARLIGQWERGEKKPGDASLRLLNIVRDKGLDAIL